MLYYNKPVPASIEFKTKNLRAFTPDTVSDGFKNDPADPKSLVSFESSIKDNKIEYARAYSAEGAELFATSGTRTQFLVDGASMRDFAARGDVVLTHNHPNGGSFSKNDINLFNLGNFKEIRAVSTRYAYTLSDPDKKFAKLTRKTELNRWGYHAPKSGWSVNGINRKLGMINGHPKLKPAYEWAEEQLPLVLGEMKLRGEEVPEKGSRAYEYIVWEQVSHYLVSEFANEYGLRYTRTRIS